MNYELTDEQKQIREKYGSFSEAELLPRAALLDAGSPAEAAELMKENLRKVAGTGFLGLGHDKEYLGSGLDMTALVVAGEAIARSCAPTYFSAFADAYLFGMILALFGSREQKNKFLPRLIKAELIGCYAGTEPDPGFEPLISATAEKSGAGWLLQGMKSMVTNGPIADVGLITACTDREAGLESGITSFIIDRSCSGAAFSEPLDKMGFRGLPVGDITLDHCETDEGSVLGEVGQGFAQMTKTRPYSWIGAAVASLGISVRAMDGARQRAMTGTSGGRPLGHYQEISSKLADMMIMTDLSRLLIYRAARALDTGDPEAAILASCAKIFAGEAAAGVTGMALQIAGLQGVMKGHPAERSYRDAKLGEIYWGSSEQHRIYVGRDVLKRFRLSG